MYLIIFSKVPSVMVHSISKWKRSMVPPQPNNSLEIDTITPFFSLLSGKYFYLNPYANPIMTYLGESIVKLDLTVRDCISGQSTGRRVLGLTTNKESDLFISL